MRLKRMLATGDGYYHVISRTTGRQFLMGPEEKDRLMGLLYRVAEFSGGRRAHVCADGQPLPHSREDPKALRGGRA